MCKGDRSVGYIIAMGMQEERTEKGGCGEVKQFVSLMRCHPGWCEQRQAKW